MGCLGVDSLVLASSTSVIGMLAMMFRSQSGATGATGSSASSSAHELAGRSGSFFLASRFRRSGSSVCSSVGSCRWWYGALFAR